MYLGLRLILLLLRHANDSDLRERNIFTNWLSQTDRMTVSAHKICFLATYVTPSPPLDNIRVMVIVWMLRWNIIRTALCWIV